MRVWILFCLISAGCIGCEGVPPDPVTADYTMKYPDAPARQADPLEITTTEFHYSPEDKRDPFAGYGQREPARPRRSGLARYPVEMLHLVAVVSGTAEPRALVSDPAGLHHLIGLGSPIGPHHGQVVAIGRRTVEVEERFVDLFQRPVRKQYRLELADEKEDRSGEWYEVRVES